jgi:hypothetical protein
MTGKTILTVVTALALVAGSVGVGHAGGGGFGGPSNTFFLSCYPAKDGPNPPYVLEVNDQFIDPTQEKVGKLKMICAFNPDVSLVDQNQPFNPVQDFDHITCYEVSKAKAKATVEYTDFFYGDPQTAKVDGPQLLCTGAVKTCLKGCPPPTNP